MPTPSPFDQPDLSFTRAVCGAIAYGSDGITAKQVATALTDIGAPPAEADIGGSKAPMAEHALVAAQQEAGTGAALKEFIEAALAPHNFVTDLAKRAAILERVDTLLRAREFTVTQECHVVPATDGPTGAEALTARLRGRLQERGVHAEVLRYCNEELITHSMFHAVTESAKSLMERLRQRGYKGDGADLIQAAFGTRKTPGPLFINGFSSAAEEAEHFGFIQLLNGIYGHFRNDRTHRTRHGSDENDQDFMEAMGIISYAHRRLDGAGPRTKE